ncbi:hypothetical protein AB838_16530 [Rhodobacteraceae bacterium (ex Bugula neritina AB1)]|nr:hypothetical protein AB838_16530 [Rhodobacteraceae bacterium (ex Bugula neritina AB1)]
MTDEAGAGKQLKTLVFHIGDHKTGTTTIQNALAAGGVRLTEAELLYPAPLNHNYLMGHIRAFEKGTEPPETKKGQYPLPELAEYIRASSADYVVISGEVFENLAPELLHQVIETYFRGCADRIRVLCYVRPHAQRILSSYAEQVKIGWFRDGMRSFYEINRNSRRFHYAPRLRKLKALFGDELTLRLMMRSQLRNGSVLEDFAHTAFDGQPCEVEEFEAENQAVTVRELALLHFLQGQFQDRDAWLRHTLGWEMVRRLERLRSPADRKVRKLAMPRALARDVSATYAEDAAAVDAEFFGGAGLLQEALAVMEDQAPVAEQSLDPHHFFSPEHLRNLTAMAQIIHDMLKTRENWPAYFHRHRIAGLEQHRAELNGEALEPEEKEIS